MTNAIAQGTPVPDDLLGPLRDSRDVVNDGDALRERLKADGYLFLRGAVDSNAILAARDEVFARLMEVGEIATPARDGISTGTSRRRELVDLGEFWQSVSEGSQLRHASHGEQVAAVMDRVFDEPSRPHDYIFLRPGVVGRSTHLHFDLPFFARGSNRIHTVWLALNEIPLDLGPLAVVEGSHRFDDLIEPVRQVDYESSNTPYVQMLGDTVDFARERGSRLLTAAFQPGDLIIFTMTTMHGTLDNHSSENRVRLSCDVRWQPADDDFDSRYTAPNPPGTTGAGYAELNGAKPLTEDWHKR
jgi:ectoine hydroxylase-related dioxygenase (phytanoyl-CoA dioxygenase family)